MYTPEGYATEFAQGKTIADLALAAGVQYYILSTVPSFSKVSNGKYTACYIMDVKSEIEDYVRSLPFKSAFFAPGSFMQNFSTSIRPKAVGDGTYVIANCVGPTTKVPLIDVTEAGKWVAAILAEPDKYAGETVCAASDPRSVEEIVQVMSKASGRTVVYKQVPDDVFKSFLPPHLAEPYFQLWKVMEEFAYYGSEQEELLKWGTEQARGKLATFEDYFERNPLVLE